MEITAEDLNKVKEIIDKTGDGYRSQEGHLEPDCLIPMLQKIQECLSYLPHEAILALHELTGIPFSRIYGVITFYEQFKTEPYGKYKVTVCRGTACHVHGGSKIIDTARETLLIEEGQRTPDDLFSLDTVPCLGACALAPIVVINQTYFGKMNPQKARIQIERIKASEGRENA